MTGRDDDYVADFKYRITTTINHIARSLVKLDSLDKVDILVTDWGSQKPLAQSLVLSRDAARISRFIYVPPAVVSAVQQGQNDFHITCASNVYLRRAYGRYVMLHAADTLVTEHGLRTLLELLDGNPRGVPIDVERTCISCSRHKVPWEFVQGQPDVDEWDRFLLLNAGNLQTEGSALLSLSCGVGAVIMHRALWHELRGLDERMGGWGGSDGELGLRVTQRYPWFELSSLGVVLSHMEHSSEDLRKQNLTVMQKPNPPLHNLEFQINDEDWGLGDYELEIQTVQNSDATQNSDSSPATWSEFQSQKADSRNLTLHQALSKLAGEVSRDHVERTWGRFNIADPKSRDILPAILDSALFLSWYGLYRHPRRYLDLGIKQGYLAAVVAAACSGIEIYGIDSWEGVQERLPPDRFATMLRTVFAHRGYVRFVNGHVNSALERLRASFIGPFSFDLASVCIDLLEAKAEPQLIDLLSHIAPGGALVVSGGSTDRFDQVWKTISERFPEFTYLQCREHKTGMILAASVSRREQEVAAGSCLFPDRDAVIRRINRSKYFWKLGTVIVRPFLVTIRRIMHSVLAAVLLR